MREEGNRTTHLTAKLYLTAMWRRSYLRMGSSSTETCVVPPGASSPSAAERRTSTYLVLETLSLKRSVASAFALVRTSVPQLGVSVNGCGNRWTSGGFSLRWRLRRSSLAAALAAMMVIRPDGQGQE